MSEGGDYLYGGRCLGKTGSFDRLEGITLNESISPFSGSDVSQIQTQTGSYSGSDLHQFLEN